MLVLVVKTMRAKVVRRPLLNVFGSTSAVLSLDILWMLSLQLPLTLLRSLGLNAPFHGCLLSRLRVHAWKNSTNIPCGLILSTGTDRIEGVFGLSVEHRTQLPIRFNVTNLPTVGTPPSGPMRLWDVFIEIIRIGLLKRARISIYYCIGIDALSVRLQTVNVSLVLLKVNRRTEALTAAVISAHVWSSSYAGV